MSKQNYAVCCYTCEHNGQETCKGCNTILNGENEPYKNWQLREDLCRKDKQIADLQHKLKVTEIALNKMSNYAINDNDLYDLVIDFNIENGRYDEDHFGIDTCDVVKKYKVENQQLKQAQNKKAIEELEGLQVQCQFDITFADYEQEQRLYDYINDRIKELKGVDVNA